jgi:hypothetical protein
MSPKGLDLPENLRMFIDDALNFDYGRVINLSF